MINYLTEMIEIPRYIEIGCFCKPLACHGDTYIEYIENRERTENATI